MSTAESTVYRASHRFARIAVTKVRPVLDKIRGEYADDALNILKFLPHRGARLVEKVLLSAMANAEEQGGVRNPGDLVIADARGDGGPMFKRLMPRARGMAHLIKHRTCHIVIGLSDYSLIQGPSDEELVDEEAVDTPVTTAEGADEDASVTAVDSATASAVADAAEETATETEEASKTDAEVTTEAAVEKEVAVTTEGGEPATEKAQAEPRAEPEAAATTEDASEDTPSAEPAPDDESKNKPSKDNPAS